MPRASGQIVEQARNTSALLKVTSEEKEQCLRDANITDMVKVDEALR